MEEKEIWKDVPNYEGYYRASTFGRIMRISGAIKTSHDSNRYHSGGILKNVITPSGYEKVSLSRDGEVKDWFVHRIIAITFIENTLNKPYINHIDFNRINNNVSNLEWVTHSENMLHSSNANRIFPPSQNGKTGILSKCSKQVVQFDMSGNIIEIFDAVSDASRITGISRGNICSVCLGNRNNAGGFVWRYA